MADEGQFGELAEISLSGQYGGRWSRSPGVTSPHHQQLTNSTSRFSSASTPRAVSYEAEDAAGGGTGRPRGASRPGLYYSPPGTSYTIVERPCNSTPPGAGRRAPRGTYLGSSTTLGGADPRKRPISPEQVLRLLSGGEARVAGRRSALSSPASSPHLAHDPHPNLHHDLLVRTVNMVRPPDSPHGFGICVKGGKDSGNYFSTPYTHCLPYSTPLLF
ncbi:hypothetical protein PR048_005424 [Dryococelus australis]|uniref:Uncharacterized protein n=1 Tax=Dryococelus australis TaxID=614101 RepID=A0ABQ9I863_9NEOP|nr:hypothetical protein PR048_005424 [Dryococelus australis]